MTKSLITLNVLLLLAICTLIAIEPPPTDENAADKPTPTSPIVWREVVAPAKPADPFGGSENENEPVLTKVNEAHWDQPVELPTELASDYLFRTGRFNSFDNNGNISDDAALLVNLGSEEREWLQMALDSERDHIKQLESEIAKRRVDGDGTEWVLLPPNYDMVDKSTRFLENALNEAGIEKHRSELIMKYIVSHDHFLNTRQWTTHININVDTNETTMNYYDDNGNHKGYSYGKGQSKESLTFDRFRYGHLFDLSASDNDSE